MAVKKEAINVILSRMAREIPENPVKRPWLLSLAGSVYDL
jgi:hypothetical protein